MDRKVRMTVTVDPELLEAGRRAVAAGVAPSLSAWVSRALEAQAREEQRRDALRRAIDAYEEEFGRFTPEELEAQRLADRANALVVGGRRRRAANG